MTYTFLLSVTVEGQSKQGAADDVLSALADASIAASLHEPDERLAQLEAIAEQWRNEQQAKLEFDAGCE